MNTLRRLVLRGFAAAALLAISATTGPTGLTSLPHAHASCGGWQYISSAATNGINIYLIRDACNNTFAYSDNAPSNTTVVIYQYGGGGTALARANGSGSLESPSFPVKCGYSYLAYVTTQYYGSAAAPSNPHAYC